VQVNLERRGKLVVGALMIGILALTLTMLQQRFDEGDYEKAILLLAAKPPGGWSVNEELVQRANNAAVDCQPRLLSSFRGTLEVTCHVASQEPYRFQVDLVRKLVISEDAHAQSILDAVAAKNHRPDAGGGAPR
jgi:hypothetical protein